MAEATGFNGTESLRGLVLLTLKHFAHVERQRCAFTTIDHVQQSLDGVKNPTEASCWTFPTTLNSKTMVEWKIPDLGYLFSMAAQQWV